MNVGFHGQVALMSILAATSATAMSCSAILPFDECEDERHCAMQGAVCVDGRCEVDESADVDVWGFITGDVVWRSPTLYTLQEPIFVVPGATLTIEAGTTILGAPGSALIVQRGGTLRVHGTAQRPVVFTSAQPEGTQLPGDWGGVALLGSAPVNDPDAVLEGIEQRERATYGGLEPTSSCGVLSYTRIEFAGFPIAQDNELNGLTLGGCGSGTLVDHVQVHLGRDDGVEVFGGSVNLRHILITRAQDDGLDWDLGWTGSAQFIAIAQDQHGDNAIEASSNVDDDAVPRSNPQLWNVTLIGSGVEGAQRALTLKEGTAGRLANAVVLGHSLEAIDIVGASTVAQLESGALLVEHSMFHDIGIGGMHYFPGDADEMPGSPADDDAGFDEASFFAMSDTLTFGVSPDLVGPYNLTNPGWVPQSLNVAHAGVRPPVELFDGFDELASYAGAFAPGVAAHWAVGWTAYPTGALP